MPLSMRRQTAEHKKRIKRQSSETVNRNAALQLLRECQSVRDVSRMTGVSRSTVGRISKAMKDKIPHLERLISNAKRAGRPSTITEEERELINERLIVAAERGFAVDHFTFKHLLRRMAADGRKGYRHGVPSDDTVRAYRARNRDIAFKHIENREQSKLAAQSYEHVETFFAVLEKIEKANLGILSNPNRMWNMDETGIDNIFGKHIKVFSSSKTKNGGARSVKSTYGVSKHITFVIAASAAGRVAPPYFIVAGKRKCSDWWGPVEGSFSAPPSGDIARFTKPGWFPLDGVIKVSDNGSMEGPLMSSFVQHIENTAKRYLSDNCPYLLFSDGHSSRKDPKWVGYCNKRFIEAAVNAANTSHFLQPCDQRINRGFQTHMRELRDEFCRHGRVDTTKVNFNLACAVYAHEKIAEVDITESFRKTGTFPFQRNFPDQFKTIKNETDKLVKVEQKKLKKRGGSEAVASVRRRDTDKVTCMKLSAVFHKTEGYLEKIKAMSNILEQAETIHFILMDTGNPPGSNSGAVNIVDTEKRVLLDAGQPAQWLTHGEEMRRRKAREEANVRKMQDKYEAQAKKAKKRIEVRAEAEKVLAEKKRKRAEDQEKRKAEKKRMRMELVKRKRERQSAAEGKRRLAEARRFAQNLGKITALSVRERRKHADPGPQKAGKVSVRSFQFVALLIVKVVDVAVEAGLGDLI